MNKRNGTFAFLIIGVYSAWFFFGGGVLPPSDRLDISLRTYAEDSFIQLKMPAAQRQDLNRKYRDPWGTYVRVDFSGSELKLTSAGKDKIFDTSDDVVYRERAN